MTDFSYTDLLPRESGGSETPYRLVTTEGINVVDAGGRSFLSIEPEVLRLLTYEAFHDISHLLRPDHLAQLAFILDDPEASPNDRFVALDLLKNANISAGGVLPMCQDTGTAIVMGKRGQNVWTIGQDEEHISRGVFDAYRNLNLRYSQLSPLSMWKERNTGSNLPLLKPETFAAFLDEKLRLIGTAACPPYHLAIVVGGTSAEHTLKTAKLASAHYLDDLPIHGTDAGHGYRDLAMEADVLHMTQQFGIGAQFGGKYFCHDVRVIRLPRHGASCPVGIAVSCSADRQALAKITPEGAFLEQLEPDPARFLPDITDDHLEDDDVVRLDLTEPMDRIRATLSTLPVKTRVSLTGPLVVARDLAHARIKEMLDRGEPLPDYLKDHAVYYAGPAKTPEGYASGSFGPTTAGRMDSYVDQFQKAGGSFVMLAKGNRSPAVTTACNENGGFYLGSIGGPAARLAQDNITKVEVLDFPELGMEAVWRIEVVDFPAFVVVDDKGNDFFAETLRPIATSIPVGPPGSR
ncbi:MAG: fumarate hydratase [Actinobacteria bacterium]|nr:fumarate hydratase [Actinomycetota bacterium]